MPAPLAKGIIIAASVLVAAGLAIYENEQVRVWLDERRRNIALALYSIGDGISPAPSARESQVDPADAAEANRKRRHDIIRRNRRDLIRRAQQEGIAVDLDELAALGSEDKAKPTISRSNTSRSFGELVGHDGKLRESTTTSEMMEVSSATASGFRNALDDSLHYRGAGARGLDSGAAFANPFDDEAQFLFDQDLIAPSEDEYRQPAETETMRSVTPRPMSPQRLIDIPVWEAAPTETSNQSQYKSDEELEAEVEEAIRRSLQDMPVLDFQDSTNAWGNVEDHLNSSPDTLEPSQHASASARAVDSLDNSLYASPSPRVPEALENSLYAPPSPTRNDIRQVIEDYFNTSSIIAPHSTSDSFHSAAGGAVLEVPEESGAHIPSGMTTPTDDDYSTINSTVSVVGAHAEDIAVLADVEDGRSDADTSESFSVVGASTPGSWTDVDSESDGEAGNGQGLVAAR